MTHKMMAAEEAIAALDECLAEMSLHGIKDCPEADIIRQALKSLEDERDQWKRFAVENAEAVLRISSDRDRLKADIAEACEVITELRDQFAFYAEEHRKSGKTEKAETNEHFRDRASQYLERVKQ